MSVDIYLYMLVCPYIMSVDIFVHVSMSVDVYLYMLICLDIYLYMLVCLWIYICIYM